MSKRSTKKMVNKVKKMGKLKLFIAFIFLLLGVGAGFGATYYLTKNDVFEIVGDTEITLQLGQEYEEKGVKAIAFGKDISSEVIIEGKVNYYEEGEYLLKYTINSLRFRTITLYKLVKVVA